MKYVMRYNVIHNGVSCEKGTEAPAKFLDLFLKQGYVEQVGEEPKKEVPVVEPKEEKVFKKKGK